MLRKKYENSKKIVQIPLFGIVRVKEFGISAKDIKKIKLHFLKTGYKILRVIVKPTDREVKK